MYEKRLREQRGPAPGYTWAAPAVLYGFIACSVEAFVLNWLIAGDRLNGAASNVTGVVALVFLGFLILVARSRAGNSDAGKAVETVLASLTLVLFAVWMFRIGG